MSKKAVSTACLETETSLVDFEFHVSKTRDTDKARTCEEFDGINS